MMIFLATDFGAQGPYMGQIRAKIAARAPGVPVIDLFSDLPVFAPRLAAYGLAAHVRPLPRPSVLVGVVDPGVGGDRAALALWLDGLWCVGPDNGLFAPLVRRAKTARAWTIALPAEASASFHGRDVFAPVAAALAQGAPPESLSSVDPSLADRPDWPDDLPEIVYIDCYGNAMTGLRADQSPPESGLTVRGQTVPRARTFSAVPPGRPLVYENANGLLEIAVNQGRADQDFGLYLGDAVAVCGASQGFGGGGEAEKA